jgi:hypothetical protein
MVLSACLFDVGIHHEPDRLNVELRFVSWGRGGCGGVRLRANFTLYPALDKSGCDSQSSREPSYQVSSTPDSRLADMRLSNSFNSKY